MSEASRWPTPWHRTCNVSWRPGSLQAYESIASIGAKFCFVNRVNARAFGEFILDYVGAGDLSGTEVTVDAPDFRAAAFARLLGEPIAAVRLLSARSFELGPLASKIVGVRGPTYHQLYCCSSCLTAGYHSIFHQLPWLRQCLIHNEPLKRCEITAHSLGPKLPEDLRYVHGLFKLWFGALSPWPDARSATWTRLDMSMAVDAMEEMKDALGEVERRLDRWAVRKQKPPLLVHQTEESRLLTLLRCVGHRVGKWESCLAVSRAKGTRTVISCTTEQAAYVLEADQWWLQRLQHTRRMEVAYTGARPRWLVESNALVGEMVCGHQGCEEAMQRLDSDWASELFGLSSAAASGLLRRYGFRFCPRLEVVKVVLAELSEPPTSSHDSVERAIHDVLRRHAARQLGWCDSRSESANGFEWCNGESPAVMSLPAPLVQIADQLLMAWVRSVAWTAQDIERGSFCTTIGRRRLDPIEDFGLLVAEALPALSIYRHSQGLELRMYRRTPIGMPSWRVPDRAARSRHLAECVSDVAALNQWVREAQNARHERAKRAFETFNSLRC